MNRVSRHASEPMRVLMLAMMMSNRSSNLPAAQAFSASFRASLRGKTAQKSGNLDDIEVEDFLIS